MFSMVSARIGINDWISGISRSYRHSAAEGVSVMRLFTRLKPRARTNGKQTWRERRAAERTARAEARLRETEEKIHEIAGEVRSDLHRSA